MHTAESAAIDAVILCGRRWLNHGGDAECELPEGHNGPHQGHLVGSFRMDADGWRGAETGDDA